MKEPQGDCQLAPFTNVRARLQRIGDAKTFSAWVVSSTPTEVSVELQEASRVHVGERFHVELSGIDRCAAFQAEINGIDSEHVCLTLVSAIRESDPYEEARIRVSIDAMATLDATVVPVKIEDVSATGIGILSPQPMPRWAQVALVTKHEAHPVRVVAQVRYSRATDEHQRQYRIGLFAPDMQTHIGTLVAHAQSPRAA